MTSLRAVSDSGWVGVVFKGEVVLQDTYSYEYCTFTSFGP
jgi:hypothetical protein